MTTTSPDREGPATPPQVYVCGHRNPDTDSVASAIAYAELKNQLDPTYEFVPVRLGHANAQTQWLIERTGATLPDLLTHVKLRVRDVMRVDFPVACRTDPVREVGLKMAGASADLVPIVDDAGVLCGVLTERRSPAGISASRAKPRGSTCRRHCGRSSTSSRGGSRPARAS